MFIDDLVKGFTSGTFDGISKALDRLIEEFHLSPDKVAQIEQTKAELQLKLAELEQRGIDSARQRESVVKDPTPSRLAYLSIGMFGVLAASVIFYDIPPTSHDIVIAMLSWIGGFVSSAFLYYFGSSHGSKEKDAVIQAISKR